MKDHGVGANGMMRPASKTNGAVMRAISAALCVLNQFWDLSIPVNTCVIANNMGIKVFTDSNIGKFDGYYCIKENIIVINGNDPPEMKRLCIAHNIGHALLGCEGTSYEEAEANTFAIELVMPRDAMQVMVEIRGLKFDGLCKTFRVSPTAMRIRLEQLGYI